MSWEDRKWQSESRVPGTEIRLWSLTVGVRMGGQRGRGRRGLRGQAVGKRVLES